MPRLPSISAAFPASRAAIPSSIHRRFCTNTSISNSYSMLYNKKLKPTALPQSNGGPSPTRRRRRPSRLILHVPAARNQSPGPKAIGKMEPRRRTVDGRVLPGYTRRAVSGLSTWLWLTITTGPLACQPIFQPTDDGICQPLRPRYTTWGPP